MREEKKVIKKILQIPLAKQKLIWQVPKGIFRITSTFELDGKLATIILFFNRYPKAIGNFSSVLCVARQISTDDISTAKFYSQT